MQAALAIARHPPRADYCAADHARAYADAGAAAISVLTEPTFFDGSLEDLMAVARRGRACRCCARTSSSIAYQMLEAVAAGADAVLLIVGALSIEPRCVAVGRTPRLGARRTGRGPRRRRNWGGQSTRAPSVIGVNSRNLRTLAVEPRTARETGAFAARRGRQRSPKAACAKPADLGRLETAGYRRVPGRRAADCAGRSRGPRTARGAAEAVERGDDPGQDLRRDDGRRTRCWRPSSAPRRSELCSGRGARAA